MATPRPYFKKTDLLAVALVLLTAGISVVFLIFSLTGNSSASVAEIKVNTELVNTINLSEITEPYTIVVEGNFPVTLEVSREGVRFIDSDCPDKLCIHSGLIKANSSAACLPAGVSVTVKGHQKPEVDGIVG